MVLTTKFLSVIQDLLINTHPELNLDEVLQQDVTNSLPAPPTNYHEQFPSLFRWSLFHKLLNNDHEDEQWAPITTEV